MNRSGNKERRLPQRLLLPLVVVLTIQCGCKEAGNTDFQGILVVKLVDAPAMLERLEIVFRRVQIHRAGNSETVGWRVVSDDLVTQDIIKLRNGKSTNIVSTTVPEGTYDKIQVLFGISSLTEGGLESTIEIPLELNDGVTIEHVFDVIEDQVTGITFDFDATRSIKVNEFGRYELRPIVRVQNTDVAGSIVGSVVPDSIQAIVSTAVMADSVTTLTLAQSGNNSFELVDLPEGSYTISITPSDPAYADTTLEVPPVVRRQKSNVGAVVLQPR